MNNGTNLSPPWPSGVSGNPGGRPKGRSLMARLRELLERDTIDGKPIADGKQVADLVAEVIVVRALKGDHRFLATLLERTEGKVPDRLALDLDAGLDFAGLSDEELEAIASGKVG